MPCRDVIPFTVEYTTFIFGAGTLISPAIRCATSPTNCCEDDDEGVANGDGPACCLHGFLTQIAATFEGNFLDCESPTLIAMDLYWDENLQAYGGESPSYDGVTLVVAIWCADAELDLWEGVASWYFEGEFVASFDLALTPGSGEELTLDGETIVPEIGCEGDVANTVSYSFEYPCEPAPTIESPCCPAGIPASLTLAFSGGLGSFPLTWNAGTSQWETGEITPTGCGTMNISLRCTGTDVLDLEFGSVIGAYDCVPAFNALGYTRSCSPFSVETTVTFGLGCPCLGPYTVTATGT